MNYFHLILDCIGNFEQNSGKKAKFVSVSPAYAHKLAEEFGESLYKYKTICGLKFGIDTEQSHSVLIR